MKKYSFENDILPLKDVLYRLALRIVLSREEAEDIVQDTLIRVWERRDTWYQIDSIEAFTVRICRNLALDRIRKASSHNASLEQDNIVEPSTHTTPYERAMQKEKLAIVKRIVDELPEKQRACIQLRDFEGKQYKEIAETLDMSEDLVKVTIFRARQTIRQKFKQTDNYGL